MSDSAYLRTLREACGFTVNEAAHLAGVAPRTWQHWESPDNTSLAKPDVIDTLHAYLALYESIVNNMLDSIDSAYGETGEDGIYLDDDGVRDARDTPITLTRYVAETDLLADLGWQHGLAAYNASLRYVMQVLIADGYTVNVEWYRG